MSKATENTRTRRAETRAFEDSNEELTYGSKDTGSVKQWEMNQNMLRDGQAVRNENSRHL